MSRFAISQALATFLLLFAAAAALFGGGWWFGGAVGTPWAWWGDEGAIPALYGYGEVTVGVLGIAITVVAILVELAANRYTPRITELFVRDPVNRAAMAFFVVTSVIVAWTELSLHATPYPRALALGTIGLMTTSQLLLLPYFAYVFDFLSPTRVIERIQRAGSNRIVRLSRGRQTVDAARAGAVQAVEQLGDIALNSVDKKDKPLTLAALAALARLAEDAIRHKGGLPDAWFDTSTLVRGDQDFLALHPDLVRALTERRTWLEMKVLRQFQDVFSEAVNKIRDVNHLIAIHTRHLAVVAMDVRDAHALRLSLRFLNTFLRNAINSRDVRSSYNLFNEYRLVAEHALAHDRGDVLIDIATSIQFYGQLAFGANLPFLLETAAYDLGDLLQVAHARQDPNHDALLALFLELDREPEGGRSQEASLRGVRKAQIKLATWYLTSGDEGPARRIWQDLSSEPVERLTSIRNELLRVTDAEYWEVSDRGINFEWLPPAQRPMLDTFFGWFDEPQATDSEGGSVDG